MKVAGLTVIFETNNSIYVPQTKVYPSFPTGLFYKCSVTIGGNLSSELVDGDEDKQNSTPAEKSTSRF